MERFTGQDLGQDPHIAVLFYDAIGDFIAITPLLRGLREKYPRCAIDYFSGEQTSEIEEASPLIDSRCSVFGRPAGLREVYDFVARRERETGPYDLAINCDFNEVLSLVTTILQPRFVMGNCYFPHARALMPIPDNRIDNIHGEIWAPDSFLARYSDILKTNFIGEIFCRLARLETDFQRTETPIAPVPGPIPPVLIATGTKRRAKLWPIAYWERLIGLCTGVGIEVGLLGAKPADQARHYHAADSDAYLLARTKLVDLRGKFTLPEVGGALQQAKACVTIDNGIMHLSVAAGTRTLALFGASPWKLWAPRVSHLEALLPETPCSLCEENRFRNEDCLLPQHLCMESIFPERVSQRLREIVRSGK
ncbi:MAG: glycosyltransferase family 9 protein [Dehalococcoidia bacterium]|nr:glycosyltransferase family 9 protein [Dehalococcoidia bacterium]